MPADPEYSDYKIYEIQIEEEFYFLTIKFYEPKDKDMESFGPIFEKDL